jgi:hypothetical protein
MILRVAQGRVIEMEIFKIFIISVVSGLRLKGLLVYVKLRFSRIRGDVLDSAQGKDVKMWGGSGIEFRIDNGR